MAIQLKLRRGTETENNTFTGAEGEVTVDTTNDQLRLHDNNRLGGWKVAKDEKVVHNTGGETIAGVKTFTNVPVFAGGVSSSEGGEIKLAPTNNSSSNTAGGIDVLGTGTSERIRLRFEGNEGLAVYTDGKAKCTAPAATSLTTDTYVATTGWVNDSSKSTNVVHRTHNGAETISGNKTFSGTNTFSSTNTFSGYAYFNSSNSEPIRIRNPDVSSNISAPSSDKARAVRFEANDGTALGQIYMQVTSTGAKRYYFRLFNPSDTGYIDFIMHNGGSGNRYLLLPELPTANGHAANKQYVDTSISNIPTATVSTRGMITLGRTNTTANAGTKAVRTSVITNTIPTSGEDGVIYFVYS